IHEQNKGNEGPLNNLAWLLAAADGKGAEALALVNQAIDLAGPTPDLLDTRALAHMAMNRSDLATKDLQDALASGPSADKWLHLAQASWMAKDRKGAESAIQKAKGWKIEETDLHPLDQKAYQRLAAELRNQ